MKTSNLVALMMSVVLSTAVFTAIANLFSHASGWQQQSAAELTLHR